VSAHLPRFRRAASVPRVDVHLPARDVDLEGEGAGREVGGGACAGFRGALLLWPCAARTSGCPEQSKKGEGLTLALLVLTLLSLLAGWLTLSGLLGIPTKNEIGGSLRGTGRRHDQARVTF
jgi:hypothetical protein